LTSSGQQNITARCSHREDSIVIKRRGRWVVLTGASLAVAIQLLPLGRDHINPPVRKEPM
jgi:hypothetical protein